MHGLNASPKFRVAMVTGATGGVGAATWRHLSSLGYRVVACGRSSAILERMRAETGGSDDLVLAFDLGDAAATAAAVGSVTDRVGHLDVLVNNAATWHEEPISESVDDHWRAVFEINVVAAVRLTRLTLPLLRASAAPRIVNVSSKNAARSEVGLASYSASKAALESVTRSMAIELAGDGILVNAVAPGVLDTSSNASVIDDLATRAAYLGRIPTGAFGHPDDVARVVGLLADSASRFITGSVVTIDGGQLAGDPP